MADINPTASELSPLTDSPVGDVDIVDNTKITHEETYRPALQDTNNYTSVLGEDRKSVV